MRPQELVIASGDDAAGAAGLAGSFTLGVGQFCTKPGLVFALGGTLTANGPFYMRLHALASSASTNENARAPTPRLAATLNKC